MLKVNMRTGETEQCSLLDLMDGGVKELADRDLQRVLENLKDVNTDPKKARSISVKFTLTGDDAAIPSMSAYRWTVSWRRSSRRKPRWILVMIRTAL